MNCLYISIVCVGEAHAWIWILWIATLQVSVLLNLLVICSLHFITSLRDASFVVPVVRYLVRSGKVGWLLWLVEGKVSTNCEYNNIFVNGCVEFSSLYAYLELRKEHSSCEREDVL